MIEIRVGSATVRLEALEVRNQVSVVSQTYDVDALLHAVQRACEAAMTCEGVQTTLSDLRKHLRSHAGQTCPGAVIHVDDPVETGREAALAQWHERWEAVQRLLKETAAWGVAHELAFERVAQNVPVGESRQRATA